MTDERVKALEAEVDELRAKVARANRLAAEWIYDPEPAHGFGMELDAALTVRASKGGE
jgi:hypothetical protein